MWKCNNCGKTLKLKKEGAMPFGKKCSCGKVNSYERFDPIDNIVLDNSGCYHAMGIEKATPTDDLHNLIQSRFPEWESSDNREKKDACNSQNKQNDKTCATCDKKNQDVKKWPCKYCCLGMNFQFWLWRPIKAKI